MSGFIYGVSVGLFIEVIGMTARVEELEGRLLFDDDTVKRIAKDNEDLNRDQNPPRRARIAKQRHTASCFLILSPCGG